MSTPVSRRGFLGAAAAAAALTTSPGSRAAARSGGETPAAEACVFCEIVRGTQPASIVWQDALTMAFMDLRQFHAGHTLVIPRQHLHDVRELDYPTGAALMASVARITRAVAAAFPNQGLSLWHSIGEAAHQEVPHLHIHVHPRLLGDQMLQIYPSPAPLPDKLVRDGYAATLRAHLD